MATDVEAHAGGALRPPISPVSVDIDTQRTAITAEINQFKHEYLLRYGTTTGWRSAYFNNFVGYFNLNNPLGNYRASIQRANLGDKTFQEIIPASDREKYSRGYLATTPEALFGQVDDVVRELSVDTVGVQMLHDQARGDAKKFAELYRVLEPVYVNLRVKHGYNHHDLTS